MSVYNDRSDTNSIHREGRESRVIADLTSDGTDPIASLEFPLPPQIEHIFDERIMQLPRHYFRTGNFLPQRAMGGTRVIRSIISEEEGRRPAEVPEAEVLECDNCSDCESDFDMRDSLVPVEEAVNSPDEEAVNPRRLRGLNISTPPLHLPALEEENTMFFSTAEEISRHVRVLRAPPPSPLFHPFALERRI